MESCGIFNNVVTLRRFPSLECMGIRFGESALDGRMIRQLFQGSELCYSER